MIKHICVVCLETIYSDQPASKDAKFLCQKCFKKVQKAYKRKQEKEIMKRPQ